MFKLHERISSTPIQLILNQTHTRYWSVVTELRLQIISGDGISETGDEESLVGIFCAVSRGELGIAV
jgi:hypothetical protein